MLVGQNKNRRWESIGLIVRDYRAGGSFGGGSFPSDRAAAKVFVR
jgi:hypothetical protein